MERALSAPGKLFVSGEYAVLWGGVSRVAAVAPRTSALVRTRTDAQVHLCLEEGTLAGRTTPRGVRWEREVPAGFAFVARTVDEALRAHGRECVGKLSGAGGGDGCILFAPDVQKRDALLEGLAARGFHSMVLDVAPGLRSEGQADPRLRAWLDARA